MTVRRRGRGHGELRVQEMGGTGGGGTAYDLWRRPRARRALQHGAIVAPRLGVPPDLSVCSVARRRAAWPAPDAVTDKGAGMPIAITDEHQELGATVRGVLTRSRRTGGQPGPARGRRRAAPVVLAGDGRRSGWLGVHLPEEHGGAGAGLHELVVVLDELGRQVAPGPVPARPSWRRPSSPTAAVRSSRRASPPRAGRRHRAPPPLGWAGRSTLGDGALDGDGGVVLGGAAADLVLLLRAGDDVVVVRRDADGLGARRCQGPRPVRGARRR